ncbi:MAG: DUF721 domain-containing protein [Spirochaetia bacterium]|nr:DUF721 domain-containing protein [Spirochaetia bacterium]MCF7952656.1 DUF721 domain-containing protein [Spirochaetales bacterium]
MKKASELIDEIFKDLKYDEHEGYISVFRKWDSIVGYDIAAHAKLKEIENHTLLVEVDHPGWSQMVSMKKKVILKRVQREFPELDIHAIRVLLG